VLFSLSALTATENAGRSNKSTNDDAVLDMRPSGGAPPRNNARAGMDDIMNLGGGMVQAPILAPPPLLAPVIEPPSAIVSVLAPVETTPLVSASVVTVSGVPRVAGEGGIYGLE
jgi:hypothetical protein